MKKILILFISILIGSSGNSQALTVSLVDESKVSDDGLFFDGEKGVDYQFSPRISPHGDCIDVVNGYVFVTWYKGGMDKRNLMLSRKNTNDPAADWVTIEFPHAHIGYQGNPDRGDSHNTAAIGICTIDSTIHLLYDMHAYRSTSYPDDFFNYSVSIRGAAFKPDSAFNLSLFNEKRTYLREGENYDRVTYPTIIRADDGSLVARYRIGGSGNGDIFMTHYNGNEWSQNWLYAKGTIPLPDRYSLYGSEKYLNGTFYSCFSIRYAQNDNYVNNNGFYFAYTNSLPPTQNDGWFDANGNIVSMPIEKADVVKVAEPSDDYGTAAAPRTSFDPAFTVTESGAIHIITRVDNTNVHYYRAPGESSFSSNAGGLIPNPNVRGDIFSVDGNVFMVELVSRKPVIKSTPEGKNEWEVIYSDSSLPKQFNHFDAVLDGNKLYVYLMENGSGDARPLFLQVYELSTTTSTSEEGASLKKITVYPNPGSGHFNISSDENNLRFSLISLRGNVIKQGTVEQQWINLSDYPTGIYLLRLSNDDASVIKKVIIN